MSSSMNTDKLSLHGKIKQAIGPYFLWLQIDEAETRCVVRLGDRAFPPVVLSVGLPALVPPSPRGKASAPAVAMATLRSGVLLSDTKFRQAALKAIAPGLQPVTDLLGSLRRQARAVPAVILDASPSEILGLRETFQELLPDQPVFLLQDLKLDEATGCANKGEKAIGPVISPSPPSVGGPRPVGPITWLAIFAVFGFAVLGVLGLQRMDLVRADIAGVTRGITTLRHDLLGQLPLAVPASVRPMVAPHLPRSAAQQLGARPATNDRTTLRAVPPTTNDQRPTTNARRQTPDARRQEHGARRIAHGAPRTTARAQRAMHSAREVVRPTPRIAEVLDLSPSPSRESRTDEGRSRLSALGSPSDRNREQRAESRDLAPAPMVVTPAPPSTEALSPDLPSVAATISSPLAARLSLVDALRRVAANDLEVQAAGWRREGRAAAGHSAGEAFRPQGSLEGGIFTRTNSYLFGDQRSGAPREAWSGEREWSALLGSMDIDVMGRRKGLKQVTAAAWQQGSAAIDVARERAAYETALLYVDAIRASAETEARQELLTLEREGWRAVQARLTRGDVSRLDLAQSMNRVATAQSHLAAALARQEVAELNLGASLRVASGSRVQPDPADSWLTAQVTRIASQPARTGAMACAEVVESGTRVKESQALAALARKGDPLRLTAHGGVALSGRDGSRPKPLVGLRLSVPFTDHRAQRFRMREAQAQLEQAAALHQKAIERATAEIVAVQVELLRSRERLAAAGAALTAAREAVRLAQLRYQAGYAPLSDLLQAQAQLGSALLGRTELQHAERRAQIELLRLTGHLLRSSAPV